MNKTPFTRFRLQTFPDLTTANASTEKFGYGDFIAIAGDITRFKIGNGYTISAKSPAAPTGKTFAQLPWVYTASVPDSSANPFAVNATATITAAHLAQKYVTSTSAAAVTLTLPTATQLATQLGATAGVRFTFTVDNSAGANPVTVAPGAGMTKTGTGPFVVPTGAVFQFEIDFTGTTTANILSLNTGAAANVPAITDNSGGASGGNTIAVLVDAGGTAAGAPTTASVANALATIAAKQNAILVALKGAGLMV